MINNRNNYKYQKIRGLERKLFLIKSKGGKCEKCGYGKNLAALDFHHKNPNEKENQLDIRKLSNSTFEWIKAEAEKCILLCANCHREHHHPNLEIDEINIDEIRNRLNIAPSIKSRERKTYVCSCGNKISSNAKMCQTCRNLKLRKVVRPTYEELIKEIKESNYSSVARKYKVSDKTIVKWVKVYEKQISQ